MINFLKKCGLYAMYAGAVVFGWVAECMVYMPRIFGIACGMAIGESLFGAFGFWSSVVVGTYMLNKPGYEAGIVEEIERDVQGVLNFVSNKLKEIDDQERERRYALSDEELEIIREHRARRMDRGSDRSNEPAMTNQEQLHRENNRGVVLERVGSNSNRDMEPRVA